MDIWTHWSNFWGVEFGWPHAAGSFFTEEVVVSDLHQYVFQIIKYCKDVPRHNRNQTSNAMTHILRQIRWLVDYLNQALVSKRLRLNAGGFKNFINHH